jgi:hypothetical protein
MGLFSALAIPDGLYSLHTGVEVLAKLVNPEALNRPSSSLQELIPVNVVKSSPTVNIAVALAINLDVNFCVVAQERNIKKPAASLVLLSHWQAGIPQCRGESRLPDGPD